METEEHDKSTRSGLLATACTFAAWGLMPVFWRSLRTVPLTEVLCHRVVWSVLFLSVMIGLQGGWKDLLAACRSSRTWALSALSGAVIGANWCLYIWAVTSEHVLETSLGYYINPLVNVLLGYAFFSERLRRVQIGAVLLAVVGVANLTIGYGHFPWIGLALAISFAVYGALRKVTRVGAIPGQWIETFALSIPGLGYLLWLHGRGGGTFGSGPTSIDWLLAASGVLTALPLAGFAYGVRRLSLTTVGILQYISPTILFLLGVFIYREPFTSNHLVSFGCIWLGVLAYTFEGIWQTTRLRAVPAA